MLGSYLIAYRDGPGRRRALRALLDRLARLPGWEIVVVEQDAEPVLAPEELPSGTRYRFAFNPGPFAKAWGMNVAARLSRGAILAIADADVVLPAAGLAASFAACRDRFDAVNPYTRLIDLDERETDAYLCGALPLEQVHRDGVANRAAIGEHISFCGGICLFRREVYFALGGMDEHFLGWGGEDDALTLSLRRYTDNIAEQRGATAYHLWHPRAPESRYGHSHYRPNVERLRQCQGWTRADWERHWDANRRTMGAIGRYAGSGGS